MLHNAAKINKRKKLMFKRLQEDDIANLPLIWQFSPLPLSKKLHVEVLRAKDKQWEMGTGKLWEQ